MKLRLVLNGEASHIAEIAEDSDREQKGGNNIKYLIQILEKTIHSNLYF